MRPKKHPNQRCTRKQSESKEMHKGREGMILYVDAQNQLIWPPMVTIFPLRVANVGRATQIWPLTTTIFLLTVVKVGRAAQIWQQCLREEGGATRCPFGQQLSQIFVCLFCFVFVFVFVFCFFLFFAYFHFFIILIQNLNKVDFLAFLKIMWFI